MLIHVSVKFKILKKIDDHKKLKRPERFQGVCYSTKQGKELTSLKFKEFI